MSFLFLWIYGSYVVYGSYFIGRNEACSNDKFQSPVIQIKIVHGGV